jgi:dipeptidyl aminopeptidase/acylaminoacyl peptidase
VEQDKSDVMAALDEARRLNPELDGARLGVIGGSHGGTASFLPVSSSTYYYMHSRIVSRRR